LAIQAVSFTPAGRELVFLDSARSIVTVDVASGTQTASFSVIEAGKRRPWGAEDCLSLSPDGATLALMSLSNLEVDLWDARTGRRLYTLPGQHGTIWWLAWSPDSRRLAVSRANGDTDVWNLHEVQHILAGLGLNGGEPEPGQAKAE
jgi:WD40 repeat protein